MGRHHARVLRTLDGVELVAGADPRGDVHGALSGLPVAGDVSDLLRYRLDYAVVACSTTAHSDVGVILARAGVAALIEKPLAHTVAAAQDLIRAFDAAGVAAAVGHVERYNPAVVSLKSRLENGDLGEMFQVVTRRQGPPPYRSPDVGVVKDLATHDLDLTMWVTGARYLTVTARVVWQRGSPYEDLVTVLGDLDSGAIACHLVSRVFPVKERVSIVLGERGCLVADHLTAGLTFLASNGAINEWDAIATLRGAREAKMVSFAIPKREPLVVEHQVFRDYVAGDAYADVVSLADGLSTLSIAESVLESAQTRRTVSVVGLGL